MENKQKEKPKKGSGKRFLRIILISLIVAIFLLGVGYIYFEYNRLSYFNLNLQNGWRSYLAYLIDFIPGLRNLSNYEYLEISDPFYLQKELLDTKLKAIQDKREKLIAEQNELQKLLDQVSQESASLMVQREELEKLNQDYQQKIAQYNDYNTRINTLANWLARSTPQQIANALSREEVSVELLVDALATLESKSAAEILQALALVNPQKAAEVIAKMGEKRSE
ncbi:MULTISPECIES: hypothetical protein [Petrotoga]|uniref:Flagellar motility protein MotE (MotC chaperone) n=2 Tax=Petrotoga sibirica TaxID=156202 RepID=A0A4R8F2B0_9BACT|nr:MULTISPECIES: hypothetical protein [Petrotoga]POZ89454.1 hypothetical protein AA80_00445 [Petrotoga sibirica DSM 13575]POZ91896.1 hypothetical protein AD60_00445 [Petrotoga sp. SL27]TDX16261.1 hypothetical protein C8D74_10480 [Petrotoga sibirica]